MVPKYSLEPNPNRVYTPELRREYNAGLRNTKVLLRSLPIVSVAGAMLGHFGSIWIDPLYGAGLLLLIEFYISSQFSRLRVRMQDALSNKYRKDFRMTPLVGIAPGFEQIDFGGDPSWDLGFLELDKNSLRFYGDECKFALLPQEITVGAVDGRANVIRLTWKVWGGPTKNLEISVRHSSHAPIGKARRALYHQLQALEAAPPARKFDEQMPIPPIWIDGRIFTVLRDPSLSPLEREAAAENEQRAWLANELAHLIWHCPCGEVNINSHKRCKMCEERREYPMVQKSKGPSKQASTGPEFLV